MSKAVPGYPYYTSTAWKRVIQSIPASYTVWKDGATYRAECNFAGGTDYGPLADATTVIQAATDALTNGGTISVRTGIYPVTNIVPDNDITLIFENGATFANSNPGVTPIFRHVDDIGGLSNFQLINGHFTGGGIWYSRGKVLDCIFDGNIFEGANGVNSFILQFDSFAENWRLSIVNNKVQGLTGGWDMFASGYIFHSLIAHNTFINGDGQGFASAVSSFNRIIGNDFYKVGNPVGLEGVCEENTIEDNHAFWSGNLKLSEFNSLANYSRGNIVSNNLLYYGGGIEAGQSYGDAIENNIIFRSSSKGIYGCFDRGLIQGNLLYETNWNNDNITIAGGPHTDGGIDLFDLAPVVPFKNVIRNNLLFNSVVWSWTHPNGTVKVGHTGGICVDTSYSGVMIKGNSLDDTIETIINGGALTKIKDNDGFVTENSGTATIPNGAATTGNVDHGLAGTPTVVHVTGSTSDTEDVYVSSKDASHIVIDCVGNVGGDRTVYWSAEYKP